MNYSVDQDPNRSLTFILYILYIVAIFFRRDFSHHCFSD